jgi:uncharacterized protein YutE (UPF0331/DUF86 family)
MVIVYVLIERILRDFVKEIDPERYRTHRTTRELIDILFLHELITQEEKVAFDQFLEFRNRIIHGQTIVSEDQAARLLDIGWRLVSLLG